MNKSKEVKKVPKNNSHHTNRGNSQQSGKSHSHSESKTVTNSGNIKAHAPPDTDNRDKTAQKSRATYSAQYKAPTSTQQQNGNTNTTSFLNAGATGYPSCNGMPLYNTSSKMMYNQPNFLMKNGVRRNMQYSCPCSNVPPPMPPSKDDLWDLQFCRWWGWNWIRKREEMLNQKRTNGKANRTISGEVEQHNNNTRRKRRKYHDFFSWCNKLLKGNNRKRSSVLKDVEKRQLQELYDTPCSSIAFNKCPCPMDDWECRSLDLKGEYECYCDTNQQTSRSTIIINQTRRQRCKKNMRKHQSWVCEKTDSSSSDEMCPCVCVCPQRKESSTEESVEYLSMRMAQVKSDDDDNQECCICTQQKETKKNICCPCKIEKKEDKNVCCICSRQKESEKNVCCPCKINKGEDKNVCCTCGRQKESEKNVCCPCKINKGEDKNVCCTCSRQKESEKNVCCPCKTQKREDKNICCPCMIKLVYTQPSCNKSPKLKCYCNTVKQKNADCNKDPVLCSSPVRQTSPSRKIPQFRRFPLVEESRGRNERTKRKYVNCNCQKKKPFAVDCFYEQPRKRKRMSCKPKEVDCYCCCCCCCCCCNKNNSPTDLKVPKSKSEKSIKQTADKCICSKSMVQNLNVLHCATYSQINDANFCKNFPIGDGMLGKVLHNNGQFSVSKAMQEGLYSSPVTGRLYDLNPNTFTVNHVLPQSNLPEPLDINEKVFSFNPIESSAADEEHKVLLSAVCEAIMSSRLSKKEYHDPRSTFNKTERSSNNPRWYPYKRPRSYDQIFPRRKCDYFDFVTDKRQSSRAATELEELNCKNSALPEISKPFDYKVLLSPDNLKIPLSTFAMPENFKYNFKTLSKRNSVSDISEKHRYFMINGKHGPIKRKHPTNLIEPQNYKTQQLCNLNVTQENEQTQQQMASNIPHSIEHVNIENNLKEFSATNICESWNNESFNPFLQNYYTESSDTPPNPLTIRGSSNNSGGSGDSVNSDDTSITIKKDLGKTESKLFIPFNSPRNWSKRPKLPGISTTGLFSTIGDIKEFKNIPKNHTKKSNNRHNKSEQLKNQRLYNSLFSSEPPDYSEDFSNLPFNYSPIPNPQSTARNPTIYPSLVLRELPADVTQDTQTSLTRTSVTRDRLQTTKQNDIFKSDACTSKTNDTTNSVKKNDLHMLQVESKAIETTNPFSSKALQVSNSKATETLFINIFKTPYSNNSKVTCNNSKLTQTPASRTARASNTVYSIGKLGNPQLVSPNDAKLNQTSIIFNPPQIDNTKTTETSDILSPQFHLRNNFKSITVNTASTSPRVSSKATSVGRFKPSQIIYSTKIDTTDLNSNELEIGHIHLTKDTSLQLNDVKQDSTRVLFTKVNNSEKEIGCSYYNEESSEDIHARHPNSPFDNVNTSPQPLKTVVQKESSCVYLEHETPDINSFVNADVKLEQSEKFLGVVDGSNLSLPPQSNIPTTSKDVYRESSMIEDKQSLPKPFKSAIPTPVYMTATTSPFKIRYAKKRSEDRTVPEGFVKEKVLHKRESPFSMFCSPVPTKTINVSSSHHEMIETGSFSRPDRHMIITTKAKKLKMREKRWRY